MFQRNDKVYAKFGDNQVAAVVLSASPLPEAQADLVWLKIAVRNPYFADQWIITNYPDLIQSTVLTVREPWSRIRGLDM
jgi:hypothetical protein